VGWGDASFRIGSLMMWFVYLIRSQRDGSYYAGITVDLLSRIQNHNAGTGAKHTRSRRPYRLVWYEEHLSRSSATKRELEIKKLPQLSKFQLANNFVGDLDHVNSVLAT